MKRNADNRIRELARLVRAGDDEAAIALAVELERLGKVQKTRDDFYSSSGVVFPSYLMPLMLAPMEGFSSFGACVVPYQRDRVLVTIGSVQGYGGSHTEYASGDRHRSVVFAACESEPLIYERLNMAMRGNYVWEVNHEEQQIRLLDQPQYALHFSPGNVPGTHRARPRPRDYQQIQQRVGRAVAQRLEPHVAAWVAENRRAFNLATQETRGLELSRRLRSYEAAQIRLREATDELVRLARNYAQDFNL